MKRLFSILLALVLLLAALGMGSCSQETGNIITMMELKRIRTIFDKSRIIVQGYTKIANPIRIYAGSSSFFSRTVRPLRLPAT